MVSTSSLPLLDAIEAREAKREAEDQVEQETRHAQAPGQTDPEDGYEDDCRADEKGWGQAFQRHNR